jgi:hypothetical protein
VSDSQGRFSFEGLEAGKYRLCGFLSGYVPQESGQREPGGRGISLTLQPGDSVDDAPIFLTPAATVNGTVRDERGRPFAGVNVILNRIGYGIDGAKMARTQMTTQTDDRGNYRVYGVPPGEYYALVAGTGPRDSFFLAGEFHTLAAFNNNRVDEIHGESYYPDGDRDRAEVLRIRPGADLANIDFVVRRGRLHLARVHLIDSRTGLPPVALADVEINWKWDDDSVMVTGKSPALYKADTGTVAVDGLSPGGYQLHIVGRSLGQMPPSETWTYFEIRDADIDLNLVLSPSVAAPRPILSESTLLAGRVRIEGSLAAAIKLEGIRFSLESPQGPSVSATVGSDGGFQFRRVDYNIAVRLSAQSVPAGLYLKQARFNGVDLLRSPTSLAGSGTLEVVLSSNGGRIDGIAVDKRRRPAAGTTAVLVPNRRDQFELFFIAMTDRNGRFSFSDIPPGDYKLFVWETVEWSAYRNAEFLKSSEEQGRSLHIEEFTRETLEIPIIPASSEP